MHPSKDVTSSILNPCGHRAVSSPTLNGELGSPRSSGAGGSAAGPGAAAPRYGDWCRLEQGREDRLWWMSKDRHLSTKIRQFLLYCFVQPFACARLPGRWAILPGITPDDAPVCGVVCFILRGLGGGWCYY